MNKKIRKSLDVAIQSAGVDGAHHKQYTIDQMIRALTGCPMVIQKAIDCNGRPYEFETMGESEEYLAWVKEFEDGEDGPKTYEWDCGIAP